MAGNCSHAALDLTEPPELKTLITPGTETVDTGAGVIINDHCSSWWVAILFKVILFILILLDLTRRQVSLLERWLKCYPSFCNLFFIIEVTCETKSLRLLFALFFTVSSPNQDLSDIFRDVKCFQWGCSHFFHICFRDNDLRFISKWVECDLSHCVL